MSDDKREIIVVHGKLRCGHCGSHARPVDAHTGFLQDCPGCGHNCWEVLEPVWEEERTLPPAPPRPHVKVTEVVGHMMSEGGYGEGPSFLVSAENGHAGLADLMPPECLAKVHSGFSHRGRFRITVEFWPEEVTP